MPGLFDSISINSLTLRNRILMPCLDPGFAEEGGLVNQRTMDYFIRRAQGGVSFIMVGPAVFDPVGVGGAFEYRMYRDDILEGLSRLVQAIHEAGVPVGLQLHHAGRQANPDLIDGTPVAPSALMCPVRKSTPRALTVREIEKIVLRYGEAAMRAKEAGFDAVEVHGSHGYLIAEFLSRVPISNLPIQTVVGWPEGVPESDRCDAGMQSAGSQDLESILDPGLRTEDLQIDVRCHDKTIGDRADQIACAKLAPAIDQIQLTQDVLGDFLSGLRSGDVGAHDQSLPIFRGLRH